MKIFDRTVWTLITAFFAIFLVIVYVGSMFAMQYSAYINSALGIIPFVTEENPNSDEDTLYYPSNYYYSDGTFDDAAMRNNSMAVGKQVADESSVLLWNDNGALPLSEGDKVGFFGIGAQRSRYMYTGTGSGQLTYSGDDDIMSELNARGINVNSNLWRIYTLLTASYGWGGVSASSAGVNDRNYGEYTIKEAPWSAIEDIDNSTFGGAVLANYAGYKDAAIMLISRNGGEDRDVNFDPDGDNNLDGTYLDLSEAEADVLAHLDALKQKNRIEKVILLINSATPVQLMNIAKYDIDACVWVGMGGSTSAEQIAGLLSGEVTPSGHLVDTWVYDTDSAPANENFGDYTFASSTGLPPVYDYTHNDKYVVYQEGIYVGYRYYETRYEDAVLGLGNATSAAGAYNSASGWTYGEEVAYPFGHGGSYASFLYSNFDVQTNSDGDYVVSLNIKNVSDTYSGKDVLQVYLQKPYTAYDEQHGIEKASVELVGFAKTDLLAPGQDQTLTVTVDDYEFKTYDSYGAGTYILEKGDYYLAAGTSAHNALNNILAKKAQGGASVNTELMDEQGNAVFAEKITVAADDFTKWATSPYTGETVGNLFSDADLNLYKGTSDQKITYLSRSDWQGTYPKAVTLSCTDSTMVADMQYCTGIVEDLDAEMPVYETINEQVGKLSLVMLMDYDYDDPLWDILMDQTSYAEQTYLVTYGAHVLAGAESVNAPGGLSQNGPSGINQPNPVLKSCMIFPCQVNMASTWNTPLIEELGEAFGMEMMHVDYQGLNGPGANIHRSAYSGRNWEYYSEDGFMSGEMLSAETTGMMRYGAILYVKHMLLNDNERNRYGVSVWANEQSIREIYAKSYEKACAVTHLNGIMSSFNRIGTTWAGRHKGLLNDLLRGEWGFEGAVQTDAAVGRHMGMANRDEATNAQVMAEALIAGQDFWLAGGSYNKFDGYKDNATVACALREAARRMLYTQLHSTAMNGIGSDSRTVYVTPWWEATLNALKVVSPILVAVTGAIAVVSFVLPVVLKKKKGEYKNIE